MTIKTDQPLLGLATTEQLLREIGARIDSTLGKPDDVFDRVKSAHDLSVLYDDMRNILDYRTVDSQ